MIISCITSACLEQERTPRLAGHWSSVDFPVSDSHPPEGHWDKELSVALCSVLVIFPVGFILGHYVIHHGGGGDLGGRSWRHLGILHL